MMSNFQLRLLEVGCGVGNAAIPLLDINPSLFITCIDFAASAIDILSNHIKEKNISRMTAHVCCIVNNPLPVPPCSMDLVLCMFVLSAIAPECQLTAIKQLSGALKVGGKLLFRDYGRYDEAELRFRKGSKMDEHFYVRQDGTCSYFFDLDVLKEICSEAGLRMQEGRYILRQYANRQQHKARHRV
eukprot:CAMPEP_0170084220 /NCGR_PEP_ID=MMETSP0019_2-20121128/19485_1 /TAXON_ID=98059 /ORGANISM="Dinobryon sp., Strain UTEXLB2267" /LENGTH=185 /DNA_ID=CAMNT_0010300227 /DNA_START=1641 /DNA_END=2194 /DNA_ORIENTATION=+